MSNPIFDREFLKNLDNVKYKEIYARLTSLTLEEMPVESIEGRVTGGSINLDGKSSSRRTCNLTLVAQDININEFYWGLTHKVNIEIGIKNNIDSRYEDIIWFKQGIFVITTFNVSISANNYTITLNGKDKMSLINGELGGNLGASTDFANIDNDFDKFEVKVFNDKTEYVGGKYYLRNLEPDPITGKTTYSLAEDEYNPNYEYLEKTKTYSKNAIPIKTIVREMIHTYAKEPYSNIVINDLDDEGVELLEYRGNQDLYLVFNSVLDGAVNANMITDENYVVYKIGQNNELIETTLKNIDPVDLYSRIDQLKEDMSVTQFYLNNGSGGPQITGSGLDKFFISKVQYGEAAGFRVTDLTYAGELIGNIGETITSVLDKIKNMLGDFEYFYDIDGRFVFQRQKTYQNQAWSNITETEDNDIMITSAVDSSPISYSFVDNNIITAFNNTPNLNNLRNDFSIWGTRKGVSGADIPVHLRYAIDTKPTFYRNYDGQIYATTEDFVEEYKKYFIDQANKDFYGGFQRTPRVAQPGKEILPDDWWLIYDWYRFYKYLKGSEWTTQARDDFLNSPIRLFATNRSGTGTGKGFVENFDPSLYFETTGNKSTRNIWLFHLTNGIYSYTSSAVHNSSSNYSYRERDGTYTVAPFSGCTAHNIKFFLTLDEDGEPIADNPQYEGYFYNPTFPEAVQEEIGERYEEYLKEMFDNIFVCDWREIIYQMAKDYYKYNNSDPDFYINVQNNNGRKPNGDYIYPGGKTGYEQYYIDIFSFWRDLYDPAPVQNYNTQGGYYAETIDWTMVNDLTFEKKSQWIGYEKDVLLYNSAYYLPLEKSLEYDSIQNNETIEDEYSLPVKLINFKNIHIDLTAQLKNKDGGNENSKENPFLGFLSWTLKKENGDSVNPEYVNDPVNNINNRMAVKGYEVYRSFYPSTSFGLIPNIGSQPTNGTIIRDGSGGLANEYKELTPGSIGPTNQVMPVYYCVRAFYDDPITGERSYTQWSNKCRIDYRLEYKLDENGKEIEDTRYIYAAERYIFPFNEADKISIIDIVTYRSNFNNEKKYWNKMIYEHPETLNFWFDFLDSDNELAQYKVNVVGDRTKAVNDNKVTSIYFKDTPNIIFLYNDEEIEDVKSGYVYLYLDNALKNLFVISAQYKSAKDVLDEMLYQYSYCIETISITALPVYYLEPNTKIFVYDEKTSINGEYIVDKITLPLTYNGTMSITATKAVNRIY